MNFCIIIISENITFVVEYNLALEAQKKDFTDI